MASTPHTSRRLAASTLPDESPDESLDLDASIGLSLAALARIIHSLPGIREKPPHITHFSLADKANLTSRYKKAQLRP